MKDAGVSREERSGIVSFSVCLHRIRSMHEVVPKVVAIAVRMVMANWMIFCQSSFFMV